MKKAYLDWNAMSQLKNPNDSLYQKLKEYKTELELPYSPAHISDLLKGWDGSPEKEAFIRNDLKLISLITNNLFYVLYYKATDVKSLLKNPEVNFDDVKDEKNKTIPEMMDLEKLFSEIDFDEETKKKMDIEMNKLKELTLNIDFPSLSENPELAKFRGMLPKQGQSAANYLIQCGEFIEDVMKNPDTYKSLRDTVQGGLALDPKVISNWTNPYEKLDEHLPKTLFNKTLTQYISENTKKTSGNLFYDEFLALYPALDMFGFKPEGLSKKNTFENMTTDSQHAFYASHCHYFVTNDKKTIGKTKAAYTHFGILTTVCTPAEFIELISLEQTTK